MKILKFNEYNLRPKTKEDLEWIITERIKKYGTECDLNDIDVSGITDMSYILQI